MSLDLIGSTSAAGRRRRAAAAGKGPLDVDDVFSNYVYNGIGGANRENYEFNREIKNDVSLVSNPVAFYGQSNSQTNTRYVRYNGSLVDDAGNSYIFQEGTQEDNLVVFTIEKRSPSNQLLWQRSFQNANYTFSNANGYIKNGFLYVMGTGRASNTAGHLIFKINATTGVRQWQVGVINTTTEGDIIVDNDDNVYMCAMDNVSHGIVMKFNSSGVKQWQCRYYRDVNYSSRFMSLTIVGSSLFALGHASDSNNRPTVMLIKLSLADGTEEAQSESYVNASYSSGALSIDTDGTDLYAAINYGSPNNQYGNIVKFRASDLSIIGRKGFAEWIRIEDLVLRDNDIVFFGINNVSSPVSYDNERYVAKINYDLSTGIEVRSFHKTYSVRSFDGNNAGQVFAFTPGDLFSNGSYRQHERYLTTSDIMSNASSTLLNLKDRTSSFFTSASPTITQDIGGTAITRSETTQANGSTAFAAYNDLGAIGMTGSQVTENYEYPIITEEESGGLVWIKSRANTQDHALFDTERGPYKRLIGNEANDHIEDGNAPWISFHPDGFSLNDDATQINFDGYEYASWTFRKAPKFFDVVTYVGNGTAGRTIPHSLGSRPGMIITKNLDAIVDWTVWHRSRNGSNTHLRLNEPVPAQPGEDISAASETDYTIGNDSRINSNGINYVAYIFGHNEGDGEFGPNGDQDIIKCGSYNGTSSDQTINVGFEPQWIMIKNAVGANVNWQTFDTTRGFGIGDNNNFGRVLEFSNSAGEGTTTNAIEPTYNGFRLLDSNTNRNFSGYNYIYMAIRRGPLYPPTIGNEVFSVSQALSYLNTEGPSHLANHKVDFTIRRNVVNTEQWQTSSRLTQGRVLPITTGSESADTNQTYDYENGMGQYAQNLNQYAYMWKRAPGYFDAVPYVGDGATKNVPHRLGVAPEMIWVKKRVDNDGGGGGQWCVYHDGIGIGRVALLSEQQVDFADNTYFPTAHTSTQFTVGSQHQVGGAFSEFIAYLFATVPGVSKVGSYVGDGTTNRVIDCGFTTGARFVFIKWLGGSTNSYWTMFDTTRGITNTIDNYIFLGDSNPQNADQTLADIDPHPSGFSIRGNGTWQNQSPENYIFYAIA